MTASTVFCFIVLKKKSAFYLTIEGDKIQICVGQRPFFIFIHGCEKNQRTQAYEKNS